MLYHGLYPIGRELGLDELGDVIWICIENKNKAVHDGGGNMLCSFCGFSFVFPTHGEKSF